MTTLNIQLDDTLHSQANQVFASYGLSPTQAIKLFLTQVVSTKAIPLSFDYHKDKSLDFVPNEATYQAILAGRQEYQNGQLIRYELDDFMNNLADIVHAK